MSKEIPVLKPVDLIKVLGMAGFTVVRQSGSHVIMYKDGLPRPIPVPKHPKDLKKGLQSRIIKQAGITATEFEILLENL